MEGRKVIFLTHPFSCSNKLDAGIQFLKALCSKLSIPFMLYFEAELQNTTSKQSLV